MKIGIIGAGNIGGTIGRHWIAAGHEVMFGARRREVLAEFQGSVGPNARIGSPAEAAGFGQVLLFAAPYGVWTQVAQESAEALAGKLVIDAANPYANRDGAIVDEITKTGLGAGSFTQGLLPRSKVTKAFNTIFWKDLRDQANRAPPRLAIPLIGDDEVALTLTSNLIRDAGFDVVLAGGLADSAIVDPGSPIYAKSLPARELEIALGR